MGNAAREYQMCGIRKDIKNILNFSPRVKDYLFLFLKETEQHPGSHIYFALHFHLDV